MKQIKTKFINYIRFAESMLLSGIAVVLLFLSALLLFNIIINMWKYGGKESLLNSSIEILNSILLVMMIMEIVNTVTISLKSHALHAEPFLIIGVVAAIRRMLGITVESTQLKLNNPSAFHSLLIELGLLGFLVIAIASSVLILRRSSSFVHKKCTDDNNDEE